jgi:pimeloyl-ACP methyl ester carboxylesterase
MVTKAIDVSAGTIEYREEGDPDGPPVVLLHGLLMNDAQWNLVLPLLPSGFRYLMPVLPMGGHRIPMRAGADLTMPGMVDIAADYLDALDLTDVTLVVTDWGGPLFLTDTGRDKRVARLVICPCEAFDNFPPGLPGKVVALAVRNDLNMRVTLRTLKAGWLRRQRPIFGMMAKKPVPQDIVDAWLLHALADKQIRRDLASYCRTRFDRDDLIRATGALRNFTGPALVLWSDNPVMPDSHGKRLADLLPAGDLRYIPDAYVLTMLDQPQRTAAEIGAFLTRVQRPRNQH